jgi:hypothetical protein
LIAGHSFGEGQVRHADLAQVRCNEAAFRRHSHVGNKFSVTHSHKVGESRPGTPEIGQVAELDVTAEVHHLPDLVMGHFPDGGIGVRYDEFVQANFFCHSSQHHAFVRRRMPGCEDDVHFDTDLHDLDHFRKDIARIAQDGDAVFRPFSRLISVCGIRGRHPDAAAQVAGRLHRLLRGNDVDLIPVNLVHAQASKAFKAWQRFPDQIGPVVTTEVIGLEHDRAITGLLGLPCEIQLTNGSFTRIRIRVNVEVTDTLERDVCGDRIPRHSGLSIVNADSTRHDGYCSRNTGGLHEIPTCPGQLINHSSSSSLCDIALCTNSPADLASGP